MLQNQTGHLSFFQINLQPRESRWFLPEFFAAFTRGGTSAYGKLSAKKSLSTFLVIHELIAKNCTVHMGFWIIAAHYYLLL
jgi:hypothetical protein